MGFEQLAALKATLTEQAKQAQRAALPKAPRQRPSAPTARPPVDPVVRNIGKLQQHFPQAFPKNPAPKVPLKIGIFADLLAQAPTLALTEAELRDALRTWCRGTRYWACLAEAAPRVDLAGQAAGHVTAAEASRGRQMRAGRPKSEAAQPARD
ncbi:ProQ/FinO family protein [Arthrobacter sp. NPDC080086]|uniref:ProQ/FinO family protein n=1 Tax=Arthrobacter sp. NPDC080086 TaxID=3155917 RepID=UPI00344D76DB